MKMREQVMSALRWTIGARLTAQIVTWAITLVVIRILSPTDYGLLAMATVFIGFLTMFSEFGLGSAVVQRQDIDIPTLRRAFGVIVTIHFLLAGIVLSAAPLIADFFKEPRLVPIVRVLGFQFVLAAFAVMPDAMLQRRMEFRRRSLLDLSGAIASSVTTLVLALAGHGVWALVAGSLLRQAWKTVGINVLSPFRHWPLFSLTGLRSLLTYGGHLTGAQFLWFFFTQIDIVIAGKWLGKELVGFYSVAVHLSSLPNQRIASVINQVAFPAFARIQHDIESVGRNFLLGVRVLSFVAFPILWGISSVAPEIVEVVLGPRWGPVALPLQVIGLVMPLRMITTFVPNVLQGVGRSDVIFWNYVWASLVTPRGVPRRRAVGAARAVFRVARVGTGGLWPDHDPEPADIGTQSAQAGVFHRARGRRVRGHVRVRAPCKAGVRLPGERSIAARNPDSGRGGGIRHSVDRFESQRRLRGSRPDTRPCVDTWGAILKRSSTSSG